MKGIVEMEKIGKRERVQEGKEGEARVGKKRGGLGMEGKGTEWVKGKGI